MFNGLGFNSMATNDGAYGVSNEYPVDIYTRRLTQPARRSTARPAKRVNAFAHLFEVPAPARPVKVRKPKPQRNQVAAARCTCPPQRTPQRPSDYSRFRPVRTQVETLGDTIELGDLGKTPKKLSKTALKALPPQFRAAWEAQPIASPGWTNTQPAAVTNYVEPQLVTPQTNNAVMPVNVIDSQTSAQAFMPAQTTSVSKFDTITDLISRGLDTVRETKGLAPSGTPVYAPAPVSSAPLISAGINTPAGSVGGNVGIGFNSDGSLSLGGGGSISPMLLIGGAALVFLLLKKK